MFPTTQFLYLIFSEILPGRRSQVLFRLEATPDQPNGFSHSLLAHFTFSIQFYCRGRKQFLPHKIAAVNINICFVRLIYFFPICLSFSAREAVTFFSDTRPQLILQCLLLLAAALETHALKNRETR